MTAITTGARTPRDRALRSLLLQGLGPGGEDAGDESGSTAEDDDASPDDGSR